MGAGLGGALAGTALGTDRGSVVVVGTALLGRSHSSVGRRPPVEGHVACPGRARRWWSLLFSTKVYSRSPLCQSVSDDCFGLSQTAGRSCLRELVERPRFRCAHARRGLREDHFARKKKNVARLASDKYARSPIARRFAATAAGGCRERLGGSTFALRTLARTNRPLAPSRAAASFLRFVVPWAPGLQEADAPCDGGSGRRRDPRAGDAAAERVDDFS